LLRLNVDTLIGLELGLLLGTPGLAALGVLVAGVTAGLRRSGALAGILMLPLAIPLLIFGAGSLRGAGNGLPLLAAVSLFLVAITPLAAGAAIRAGRE
jgi:heme exporter protein B